jgi:hypothetical protein
MTKKHAIELAKILAVEMVYSTAEPQDTARLVQKVRSFLYQNMLRFDGAKFDKFVEDEQLRLAMIRNDRNY